MKKLTIFVSLICFLFAGIGFVSAQTGDVAPVPTLTAQPIKATGTAPTTKPVQNIRDKYKALQDKIMKKASTTQAKASQLGELHKNRILAHVKKMMDSYHRMLAKIESAEERVRAHIEKLEAKGFDLTKAKELLAIVPGKVDDAKEKIAEVKSAIEEALESENPREKWAEIKEMIREAKQAVKDAHKALRDAIRAIKASVKPTVEAVADTVDEAVNNAQ